VGGEGLDDDLAGAWVELVEELGVVGQLRHDGEVSGRRTGAVGCAAQHRLNG
jgi:hypothetical protein